MTDINKKIKNIGSRIGKIAKDATKAPFDSIRKDDLKSASITSAKQRLKMNDLQGAAVTMRSLIEIYARQREVDRQLSGRDFIFATFSDKTESTRHQAFSHWIRMNHIIHSDTDDDLDDEVKLRHCIEFFEQVLPL